MKQTSNFSYRQLHIIQALWRGNTMTSEELAILCGVSSKTIRSNMVSLMELMTDSGARLITKKGQGYTIEIDDIDQFTQFLVDAYVIAKNSCPDCPEERVLHLLFRLLDRKEVSRNAAMQYYVINLPTWNKHIKRLKEILKHYRLELKYHNVDGDRYYYIDGVEFDLRLCLVYRTTWYGYGIIRDMGGSYEEFMMLRDYLIDLLNKNHILVKTYLFEDLWTSIYYCALRCREGFYCTRLSEFVDGSLVLNGAPMKPIAEEVGRWMEENFHVQMTPNEILYLQLMLANKSEYGNYLYVKKIPIPDKIKEFKSQILGRIPSEIRSYLMNSTISDVEMDVGLIPTYMRLHHGVYIFSPELRKLKDTYPEAYERACDIAPLFDQIGRITTYEEELGLMTLTIQKQLEDMKKYI